MLKNNSQYDFINIATIFIVAMFFSCGNELKEVEDFLAEKNLPIGVAKNIHVIHTDSGKVKTKLTAPIMNDFSNRKNHPFTEFPEGLIAVSYDELNDSVILYADYSINYSMTNISEVKGNVSVINYADSSELMTEQLFWDANVHYFYTEKKFTYIKKFDTINGIGFESNEDLSKINMKSIYDTSIFIKEN